MASRSYLYVPGDRAEMLEKALNRGADALIADLEDAVAPSAKDSARSVISDWLDSVPPVPGPEIWVRVNSQPAGLRDDLAVAGHPRVTGIVFPKATLSSLEALNSLLGGAAGGEGRRLLVAPLIESAQGVTDAVGMARHEQVSHLGLGQADLQAELGLEPGEDEAEWMPIRLALVLASAAAGINPPSGPAWTAFRDIEGFDRSCRRLRRLGFGSRSAIHPTQLAVIHEVFTPSDDAVQRARRIIEVFDQAQAEGRGVAVDDAGRMIDEAVVKMARRILRFAPPGESIPTS